MMKLIKSQYSNIFTAICNSDFIEFGFYESWWEMKYYVNSVSQIHISFHPRDLYKLCLSQIVLEKIEKEVKKYGEN